MLDSNDESGNINRNNSKNVRLPPLNLRQQKRKDKNNSNKNLAELKAIFCISDSKYILKYFIEDDHWQQLQFDEKKTTFIGGLRYSSAVYIPGNKIIVTGGCNSNTGEATGTCIEISTLNISQNKKLKNMNKKRYAHASIYLNGCIYVLGGFDNKDNDQSPQSTLKSCEKYLISEDKWVSISNMNQVINYLINIKGKSIFWGNSCKS